MGVDDSRFEDITRFIRTIYHTLKWYSQVPWRVKNLFDALATPCFVQTSTFFDGKLKVLMK